MPENQLLNVRPRVDSVDLLRGVVMVLMALDHVRDFFSDTVFQFDPTDLTQTTPALFFTRWVTHFCAPVFVFVAGTGAYLSASRGKTKGELSRFLITRGVFLILLDPIVIRHSWFWDFNWRFTFGQVIWAIGWSMVVLAGLIHLPRWFGAAFGVAMIAGHNLLDGIKPEQLGAWGMLWQVLHVQGFTEPLVGFQFLVIYPLIPWIGVMAAGYAFGGMLHHDSAKRRRRMFVLGLGLTAAFIVLRAIDGYGDARAWSHQKDGLFTFLSFLNCEKYPPSLDFLLMTLGPAIAALGLLERPLGVVGRRLVVFGRVPMFYYLIHVPFVHLLAVPPALARYGSGVWNISPVNPPADYGYSLPVVYVVWASVVVTLYFPCRWYAGVKQRRRDWWLSYL
jgi:uncharacterized membrane protein